MAKLSQGINSGKKRSKKRSKTDNQDSKSKLDGKSRKRVRKEVEKENENNGRKKQAEEDVEDAEAGDLEMSDSEEQEKSNPRKIDELMSDDDESIDEEVGFKVTAESDEEDVEEDVDDRAKDAMEAFQLPDDDEEAEDPAQIATRVKEILGVLNNWRENSGDKPRSAFIEQLCKDCAAYYGYLPSLIEMFLTLFSPGEMFEFLEANETSRPVVIRTNTLKAHRRELAEALTGRGVSLEPLAEWSKVGLKIFESNVPIGATPEYLAGYYMLQSASSFAPVLALSPKQGERVLDMASAPGGKTSYIAQLMKNTGLIVANDYNKKRIQSTVSNLARLGVSNTIHVNHDGREFPKVVGGFDRVLLDAPCSGLGVIARDPSVKLQRTVDDIRTTARLQKELLLCAIDSCDHKSKTGGIVVYSTCSISVEENEMVVQYALDNRNVKIVDSGLPFGKPGLTKYMSHRFHPSMKHSRRLYPHVHNMDGFFVVKLKKTGPIRKDDVRVKFGKMSKKQKKALQEKADGDDMNEAKEEEQDEKAQEAEEEDEPKQEKDPKSPRRKGEKKKLEKKVAKVKTGAIKEKNSSEKNSAKAKDKTKSKTDTDLDLEESRREKTESERGRVKASPKSMSKTKSKKKSSKNSETEIKQKSKTKSKDKNKSKTKSKKVKKK